MKLAVAIWIFAILALVALWAFLLSLDPWVYIQRTV